MKVIMLQNVRLLGTDIVLNEAEIYDAVEATNQPDYRAKQLYFVHCKDREDSVLCTMGVEIRAIVQRLSDIPSGLRYGDTGQMAGLFNTIRQRMESLAIVRFPDDKTQFNERHEWRVRFTGTFMDVLMSYAIWANPNGWNLDFVDVETGAFGILMHGEYTCLVQITGDGRVSGHS